MKIDSRGLMAVGFFVLTASIFALLAYNPTLAENTAFTTLAGLIVGGGLINAGNYYFGSSSSSTTKDATIATMATNAVPPDPAPPQA